jgi:hypothetical protein
MKMPEENDLFVHKDFPEIKITIGQKVEFPMGGIRILENDKITKRWHVWACQDEQGIGSYKTMRELTSQFKYVGKTPKIKLSRLDLVED